MIASIKGEVIRKGENHVVIQVGGVGISVHVPEMLILRTEIGSHLNLCTNLVVREDNLSLYGFEDQRESELFNYLIKVNGIGPRLALAILSTLSVDMVYQAVISKTPAVFNQVPGIGDKTSQKIILYLYDRLKAQIDKGIVTGVRDLNRDLLDALVGLGYSVVEAQTAIQALPEDAPEGLEERLRLTLSYFSS